MSPIFKLLFRATLIVIVIFIVLQPYNLFCNVTSKCQAFYFSSLLPVSEGKDPINLIFEVNNFRGDIDFEPVEKTIETVSGRKNVVHFKATNVGKHLIRFRPTIYTKPDRAIEYIDRNDCICFHEYTLKKDETIDLKMEFRINKKFDEVKDRLKSEKDGVVIGFKLM